MLLMCSPRLSAIAPRQNAAAAAMAAQSRWPSIFTFLRVYLKLFESAQQGLRTGIYGVDGMPVLVHSADVGHAALVPSHQDHGILARRIAQRAVENGADFLLAIRDRRAQFLRDAGIVVMTAQIGKRLVVAREGDALPQFSHPRHVDGQQIEDNRTGHRAEDQLEGAAVAGVQPE